MCDLGMPCGKKGCPFEPKGGWPTFKLGADPVDESVSSAARGSDTPTGVGPETPGAESPDRCGKRRGESVCTCGWPDLSCTFGVPDADPVAERDRYKAALEAILDTPTNATVLNVHFIVKEALGVRD